MILLADVSPAILVPFYDEDSSTIFVTGRGDTTIYAYGEGLFSLEVLIDEI